MVYNKTLVMGNLTRDPQLKHIPSGSVVVEFGIACNEKYKTKSGEQRENVLFLDCVAFGRTAEVINEHFRKGKPIFLEGKLRFEQWEDKNGGGKRSRIKLAVDQFQFVGGRDGAGASGSQEREPGQDDDPNF